MLRRIEKRVILPIKWWINYKKKRQSTEVRRVDELLQKKTDKEVEFHEARRKNDKVEQDKITGFIQAIDWVCHQEEKEYKQ